MTVGTASKLIIGLLASMVTLQLIATGLVLALLIKPYPDPVGTYFTKMEEREQKQLERIADVTRKSEALDAEAKQIEEDEKTQREKREVEVTTKAIESAAKAIQSQPTFPDQIGGASIVDTFKNAYGNSLSFVRDGDNEFTITGIAPKGWIQRKFKYRDAQ